MDAFPYLVDHLVPDLHLDPGLGLSPQLGHLNAKAHVLADLGEEAGAGLHLLRAKERERVKAGSGGVESGCER